MSGLISTAIGVYILTENGPPPLPLFWLAIANIWVGGAGVALDLRRRFS